jgi:hypothetical protein
MTSVNPLSVLKMKLEKRVDAWECWVYVPKQKFVR